MGKISRRQLLQWVGALGATHLSPYAWAKDAHLGRTENTLLSAYSNSLGEHSVALINTRGEIKKTHELASRGHSFAINPILGEVYCITRRPGYSIDVLTSQGQFIRRIKAPKNRHFYGHGVSSPDGRLFYTTENNLDNGDGVVGIRDMHQQGKLVGEFSTFGIGPHSIKLSHDQRFLVVANGGVKTHPFTGRKKLNLESMSPSLVFIDIHTGKLHKQSRLAEQYFQNSIRHLALTPDNNAVIALQNQSHHDKDEVLLAYYDYRNNQLSPIAIPKPTQKRLNGYLGDVVFDHSYQYIASSSPRGGLVVFCRLSDQRLWHDAFADSCGVYPMREQGGFIVSSGGGEIRHYQINQETDNHLSQRVLAKHPVKWDNHMLALTP